MATRANKFTIRVTPSRYRQTMFIRGTGRFGKVSLSVPPTYQTGQALSNSKDAKTYWTAVLTLAQAMVESM
jgi:hypothetical protein